MLKLHKGFFPVAKQQSVDRAFNIPELLIDLLLKFNPYFIQKYDTYTENNDTNILF